MCSIDWRVLPFDQLTGHEVYDILKLRAVVFVIEQKCIFNDLDGHDLVSHHLMGTTGDGQLIAYCRLLPPGTTYPEASIGRVCTHGNFRHLKVGMYQCYCSFSATPGCTHIVGSTFATTPTQALSS